MKIEALTVALRPRSAWEAVELGTALTRRHAAAIWKPWLLLSLPMFALVNLLAWSFDVLWLAGLVVWWLKPLFDRIPLFVLSRAVFGEVPTTRQTLHAQLRWGLRWMPAYLTWRRLSPVRSLYLPVDLLEGAQGAQARQRRRALGSPVHGVGTLLTLVCVHFELALYLGFAGIAVMFVPNEYLEQFGNRVWKLLQEAPVWITLLSNLLAWMAWALISPFYVGAGFGLYLNRRTEIEAWDIELALRRMRTRLLQAAAPLVLLLAIALALPARAQEPPQPAQGAEQSGTAADEAEDEDEEDDIPAATLHDIFGTVEDDSGLRDGIDAQKTQPAEPPVETTATAGTAGNASTGTRTARNGTGLADDRGLRNAVKRAYADPTVTPKRKIVTWKARAEEPKKPPQKPKVPPLAGLGAFIALVSEYGLWAVVGVIVLILLLTSPRWLRWFRRGLTRAPRESDEVRRSDADEPQAPLPDDVPTAIRRLWREGRQREALALMYRASVESMATRTQAVLVPGATEAEVLRVSRRLPLAEERDAFARAVRAWQYAAYAQRFPGAEDFERLLHELAERFAWSTAMPRGATP
ncbi:DUF4129 domain-containing protein [Lysobacter panacisoli]|uniref:DUF4129 domain-containing protein n=1 Tax=Lysobacter panacisoli TaxID=1255263 RepID=A0ABP9KYQ2_9GAMM|nr:DUF4129 domain-containing protein [Lysobacter panacisoli]